MRAHCLSIREPPPHLLPPGWSVVDLQILLARQLLHRTWTPHSFAVTLLGIRLERSNVCLRTNLGAITFIPVPGSAASCTAVAARVDRTFTFALLLSNFLRSGKQGLVTRKCFRQ